MQINLPENKDLVKVLGQSFRFLCYYNNFFMNRIFTVFGNCMIGRGGGIFANYIRNSTLKSSNNAG